MINNKNLKNRVLRTPQLVFSLFCVLIGMGLSTAFPPIEYSFVAWIIFIPLLTIARNKHFVCTWCYGFLFGLGHFYTCLFWLGTINIFIPLGLAFYCALYPAFWLAIVNKIEFILRTPQYIHGEPRFDGLGHDNHADKLLHPVKQCIIIFFAGFLWVGFEFLRAHLFSGFSWNLLGILLWQNRGFLPLVKYTGVYGLSFLIITFNLTVYFSVKTWLYNWRKKRRFVLRSWPLIVYFFIFMLVFLCVLKSTSTVKYSKKLRVAVIQGNIPQCRQWTPEQFDTALDVYRKYTRLIVKSAHPDLFVWPETAVPAAFRYNQKYYDLFIEMMREVRTPCLIGSIDYVRIENFEGGEGESNLKSYNSVFHIDLQGEIKDTYSKIHLVPFGEYIPFEKYFPWLNKMIGMGRSLSPGAEYTIFTLKNGARVGVNICYEDAFPEISRQFVLNGANVLFTLTNDAWYKESCGSRQHLAHSVFRALENNMPMLRSGNNSDSCLITSYGKIKDIIYNSETGERFIRGAFIYEVPVNDDYKITFYARYGDIFAYCAIIFSAIGFFWILSVEFMRKKKIYDAFNDKE